MQKQTILPRTLIYKFDDDGNFVSGVVQYQIKYDTGKIDTKLYSVGVKTIVDTKYIIELINDSVRHACAAEQMEVKDVKAKARTI